MTDSSDSSGASKRSVSGAYQIVMLVLSVYAIAAIGYEKIAQPGEEITRMLNYADWVVCAVFFIDFAISLARAPSRQRYFFTWGWIDLLSSIPVVGAQSWLQYGRWGRVARIIRVIRLFRAVRATKTISSFVLSKRASSTFGAAALLSLLFIFLGSVAILEIEKAPGANINSPSDALWWAFETVTSVDYGDEYPVTTEGRLVAALLVVVGAALFGALAGSVAVWFLAPSQERERREIAELREDIAELKAMLKTREST